MAKEKMYGPTIPKDTKPLQHQVAGHHYGDGKTSLGCLSTDDGLLLKPLQAPPRGPTEKLFYDNVNSNECSGMQIKLRQFIPKYYGTLCCSESKVEYLKLEDLAGSLFEPCITDIKMGKIMYDPHYKSNCVERSIKKFPPIRILGYTMLGMRIFDCDERKPIFISKSYCRSLTEVTIIHKGLGAFLSIKPLPLRIAVLTEIVQQLGKIHDWFENQRELAFYGASLLLVYEGDPRKYPFISDCSHHFNSKINGSTAESVNGHCSLDETDYSYDVQNVNGSSSVLDNTNLSHSSQPKYIVNGTSLERIHYSVPEDNDLPYCSKCVQQLVRVKLIDFAHVHFTDTRDDNVLHGLRMLSKHLNLILDELIAEMEKI